MITTDKIRYNIGVYLWNYWQNNNDIESIRNAEKTLRNEIEIGLRRRFKDFCEYQLLCNKFSFDVIGVNVGDALTFVDGTEVIAAEDNKVSFCGELFTLSGFCKEFMPDEKRTKSNSYRGCAFFFKDGVKLEKLFKEQQKKSLASKEEIAAVPDDTLDSVPNEHLASEKCTERTITPPAKENVSERKETVSAAKVVAISIGVPSCLDIPPNNMRLDIAANKPLNAAVGDCLCGVGKVVHTLPLPPPWSKMSKITKVNQLIKKQKWKRIFVYLADLHSEMANAIDL